jgi:hypothetical protein
MPGGAENIFSHFWRAARRKTITQTPPKKKGAFLDEIL